MSVVSESAASPVVPMEDGESGGAAAAAAAATVAVGRTVAAAHSIPTAKRKRGADAADAATDRDVGGEATKTKRDESANITAETCFTDGLHAIFAFLPLIDFASSSAVCSGWAAAASSQPTRGDELTVRTELDLRAAQQSRLWRHVSVLICAPRTWEIGAPEMRAAIIAALQSSSSSGITDIRLAKLLDSGDDVKALAAALAASATLTSWSISDNRLESTASAALASAIRTSRTLRSIELHNLVMGDGCASGLAEAIKASPTLTSVSFYRNFLSAVGGSALDAAQREVQRRQMAQHVDDIKSQDEVRQIQGVTAIRKMMEVKRDPPIQQMIDANILPRLIEFLRSQSPVLQCESAWAITDLTATGSHGIEVGQTQALVDLGAIPALVALLISQHSYVQDKAVCALANLAVDAECRDRILASGALQPLLAICCSHGASTHLLRGATSCLRNLCGHEPQVDFALVQPAVTVIARILSMSDDDATLAEACWALSHVCDDTTPGNESIQSVVHSGVVPRLVALLSHGSSEVTLPTLNTISRICTGDEAHSAAVLACADVLPHLRALLSAAHPMVRKQASWTIANIAGRKHQIRLVIDADIIPPLISILRRDEFTVQKEAAWAIYNITFGGEDAIRYLVSQEVMQPLRDLLHCPDQELITGILQRVDPHARKMFSRGIVGRRSKRLKASANSCVCL